MTGSMEAFPKPKLCCVTPSCGSQWQRELLALARQVNLSNEGLLVDAMVVVVLVLRVEHIKDELGAQGRRPPEQADDPGTRGSL